VWTEGDESAGKLKWRVYLMPCVGGERKDFKKRNPEGHQQTTDF
jgi:hypothetical protein